VVNNKCNIYIHKAVTISGENHCLSTDCLKKFQEKQAVSIVLNATTLRQNNYRTGKSAH
jgi:hypothetical protein